MVLQLPNDEWGHVNVVGPDYCLCESLPVDVQSVAVCVCKVVPAKPCCLCHHVFQGWLSWSPPHGHEQTLWALLYAGMWLQPGSAQSNGMPGGVFLLCSCVMPCTEKRFILEIPERVIKHIIFTTGQAHFPLKPGSFNTKSSGTCL